MENLIVRSLFENIQYAKRVLPFLSTEYFEMPENQLILQAFNAYTDKYNTFPTYSVIKTGIIQNLRLSENLVKSTIDLIETFENEKTEVFDPDWLFDQAEQHCQQYCLENAILESSSIIGDPDRVNAEISQIVTNALRVSFNTDLGIDLFSKISMQECYDHYVLPHNKIECNLKELNDVFYILKKTCSCILAPIHGGKTNALCSLSVGYVKNGYNVLYISGEMGDKEIAKMLYANLMEIPRNDMASTSEPSFMGNHDTFKLKSASWGRYYVKEFPPASVNMKHIESYIHDLQLKTGIIFDVIMLDYLNLFLPITGRASDNTYTSIKRVSEEFRALTVVNNLGGWTATQTNRDGAKTSDLEMTDTSESFGLPATMDAMIAIIGTTDLKKQNLQIWKMIKNRMTGIIDYKIPFRTQFEYGRVVDMQNKTDLPFEIENNPSAINMANKMKSMKMASGIPITLDSDEKKKFENMLTN